MTLAEALEADRAGDLVGAARLYEEVLAESAAPPVEAFVNLAVLYWQSTDPGLAGAKKLSPDFFATAGRRFPELLAEAQRRFPTSTEPRFWSRYIAWADLGESFGSEECRELLYEDPSSLVPAMQIFAGSQGKEAEPEARELLHRAEAEGTTRARYVASVNRGVRKRAGRG